MVDFCPECGNLLRKNSCRCGYNQPETSPKNAPNTYLIEIWDPPSPKIIYCRLTATSQDKLRKMLSKGNFPEKLKEITTKIKNHLYTCCNCVYYNEENLHCQIKNKFVKKDSICKRFEPFE
ncbi:MAG: hypothetical protein ACFFCV_08060 [Promethearchaeota archaeon]